MRQRIGSTAALAVLTALGTGAVGLAPAPADAAPTGLLPTLPLLTVTRRWRG